MKNYRKTRYMILVILIIAGSLLLSSCGIGDEAVDRLPGVMIVPLSMML